MHATSARASAGRALRGFTLVECLMACAVVAVLAAMAWPGLRGHELRAGRLDGVQALARVQQAQEAYRSAHGLYAGTLAPLLGTRSLSEQGRYAIDVAVAGPETYLATARAIGVQARDTPCATLTLQVRQGFAQTGPDSACWLR